MNFFAKQYARLTSFLKSLGEGNAEVEATEDNSSFTFNAEQVQAIEDQMKELGDQVEAANKKVTEATEKVAQAEKDRKDLVMAKAAAESERDEAEQKVTDLESAIKEAATSCEVEGETSADQVQALAAKVKEYGKRPGSMGKSPKQETETADDKKESEYEKYKTGADERAEAALGTE